MRDFIEGAAGSLFVVIFLMGQFPGGTIVMALSCNASRLDGWDWVLSVIIPFYGIFMALLSSSC
jgi:hypothetical protein|tara:strand:- start:692 stop:883 length:192 start_codon:yes stop_codon:yes gene_type:complete